MIIKYKNENGTLEFNTTGNGDIRITEADGLFLPTPVSYSVNYLGCDGQTTIATYFKNRTITISGDVKIPELKKFMTVLAFGGELTVNERKITLGTPTLSIGNKYGGFVKYVLQATCDNPYFTDTENNTGIYYRKDKVTSQFTLPAVFTEGVSKVTFENKSYYTAYPEITFRCVSGGEYGGGITVENKSAGCKITLLCAMQTGESITVNTAKRTALSTKRGNMLKYIDDETYPGNFILKRGENILEVTTQNTDEEIFCDMVSGIKYAECGMYERY